MSSDPLGLVGSVRLIRGERGLGVPVRLGEAEVIKISGTRRGALPVPSAEPVGSRHISAPTNALVAECFVRGRKILGLEARTDKGLGRAERGAGPAERGDVRLLGCWLAAIREVDRAQVVQICRDVGGGYKCALLEVQMLPYVIER